MLDRTVCCLLLTMAFSAAPLDAKQPDIILIMADDVGIEGLGCYGGVSYKTPHLDQMAAHGVRFTHAYSQPLCTPTRLQLMTGKYNHRNWKSFGIMDPHEKTFGHAMSAAGYATGIFGKWQLQSYDPPDYPGGLKRRGTGMHPKTAGFDEYSLYHALDTEDKGSRYANPTMLQGKRGQDGDVKTYDGQYGEDIWVKQILSFFDRNKDRPRFVYYPMALPHWPFVATPNSSDWDPSKPQEEHLRYASDMIEYMDTAVGNLMKGLRQRNLADETIVIFYSDNGTHLKVTSKMRDGRDIPGGKAMTTQTAIHVPLIVHCPKRFQPRVATGIVDASDFYPTLAELAGEGFSNDGETRDGFSFLPQVSGDVKSTRDTAFVWYDPRPGWDKDKFTRHVFALNKSHKLFRDGRLFRLSDVPLEETLVEANEMSTADKAAKQELSSFIKMQMNDIDEPPLVDAFGRPVN